MIIVPRKKLLFIILIILICSGYITYNNYIANKKYYSITKEQYNNFFVNNKPKEDIKLIEINKLKERVSKIKGYDKEKQDLSKKLDRLNKYYLLKEKIDSVYPNGVLVSNTSIDKINEIENDYNNLPKEYKKYFTNDISDIKKQRNDIDNIELKVSGLFTNNEKIELNSGVTRDTVENIRNEANGLKQDDVKANINGELDKAINIIAKKEEEERKRQEEERKRQEEERRKLEEEKKRQEAINNAWVILNVPYISQNGNNVLNGCEAASLLMGLQYKGYLTNMSLVQYASDMPKSASNNAYEGFTHDIFGLAPNNVAHWIAPAPLAAFGRNSSGNQNVIDATGFSLDALDNELANNNPVVIYATGRFKPLKEWIEGAPRNIHVMLLNGYNKITGEQIITDSWTQANGQTKWYVAKNKLENIYNAVGKKAVIIR